MKRIGYAGSLNVGNESSSYIRRFVLNPRAKSYSQGCKRRGCAIGKPLSVSVSVCPRRDVSRVVSYYVNSIHYTVFLMYVFHPDFIPIIIYTIGNSNEIKKCSIKRDTIKKSDTRPTVQTFLPKIRHIPTIR